MKLIAFSRIYVWRSGQIGSILCVWEKTAKKPTGPVPGKPDNTTVALHMQNSCEFIFVVPERGVRTNLSNPPPYTLAVVDELTQANLLVALCRSLAGTTHWNCRALVMGRTSFRLFTSTTLPRTLRYFTVASISCTLMLQLHQSTH